MADRGDLAGARALLAEYALSDVFLYPGPTEGVVRAQGRGAAGSRRAGSGHSLCVLGPAGQTCLHRPCANICSGTPS